MAGTVDGTVLHPDSGYQGEIPQSPDLRSKYNQGIKGIIGLDTQRHLPGTEAVYKIIEGGKLILGEELREGIKGFHTVLIINDRLFFPSGSYTVPPF